MKYTLEAGRCIVRDGTPFATIHGVGAYSPTELDQFARFVVAELGECDRLRAESTKLLELIDRLCAALVGLKHGAKAPTQ